MSGLVPFRTGENSRCPTRRSPSLNASATGSTPAPSCAIGPKKMWGGFGKRDTCDGCGEPVLTTQVEYEYVVDTDVTYRFHIGCAGLWQAELKRRGWDKLDDGTSAVGP